MSERRGMTLARRGLVLLGLIASTTAACAHDGQATPASKAAGSPNSADEEATYLERLDIAINRPENRTIYEPLEVVLGVSDWNQFPKASSDERTVAPWAITAAAAYAHANNSSALIIWRNGRIEAERYFGGLANGDLINSYSLAKPITALAVGRAIALGKIRSLDQPVADFVHEWRDDPVRSKILIRHLLDMRSGFLAQSVSTEPDGIMSRSFLHPRSEQIIIDEYPITHQPGTRYEYNNATSSMVAVVIERATGRRYAEFIGSELLGKIGARGGDVWVNRSGGVAQSGCCTRLPAESFLRLAILTLQDGIWDGNRLLPAGYVKEMRQGTPQNPYYGLGMYIAGEYIQRRGWANPDIDLPKILHSEPYLASDLYLFDGNFNQVVYVVPSLDLVILRTGSFPPRSSDSEWDNTFLPNIVIRGIDCSDHCPEPQPRGN
jgi:CubicO group peptidase (beta-lactamase class C family)